MRGEWIGLAGGWCVGRRAYMNMQLNDLAHSQLSVSLVLRSYLIEELIARGMSELVFLGGSSAPLDLYCDHPEVIIMNIDKRSRPWHFVRQTWTTARKLVPNTFDNKMVRLFLKGL
jgi:GNAT acetyltransferase-like protein